MGMEVTGGSVVGKDELMSIKLEFTKNLNHVTNKIHATSNIDEIMLDVSKDICTLFNADRLTIYVVGEDNISLVSKVKTGLNSFKDLKLPIAEQSVAGYAAMHKKLLNIKDVYDEKELASYSSHLRFLQEVDKRTGYRTKQITDCSPRHHRPKIKPADRDQEPGKRHNHLGRDGDTGAFQRHQYCDAEIAGRRNCFDNQRRQPG